LLFVTAHVKYGPATMLLIAVDGCFDGYARFTSGSVLLPFGLHAPGNLVAAIKRLP
jgi:membrane protease YdiL (CAAX protease family)